MTIENNTEQGVIPNGMAQKIASVMDGITRVPKNGRHGQGYDYATADDVSATVRPLLAGNNLAILPSIVSWKTVDISVKNGTNTLLVCNFNMDLIDGDTGHTIIRPWVGAANMSLARDKAFNVCATNANKYFLKNVLHIDTGDESDSDSGGVAEITAKTYLQVIALLNAVFGEEVEVKTATVLQTYNAPTLQDLTESQGQKTIRQLTKMQKQ